MSNPQIATEKLRKAAEAAGGTLIELDLTAAFDQIRADMERYAPGCGALTYVAGTNGGRMPCGATINYFGRVQPYFCASCHEGYLKLDRESWTEPTSG